MGIIGGYQAGSGAKKQPKKEGEESKDAKELLYKRSQSTRARPGNLAGA